MAHEVIYTHPNEELKHEVDFTDELPDDTTIAAASAVVAKSSDGTTVTSTILSGETESGMKLSVVIAATTAGETYQLTFTGRGATTTRDRVKVVEVRSRENSLGGL